MEFKIFEMNLQKHFKEMCEGAKRLFKVNVDQDYLWNLYLESFPEQSNPIFRTRRKYDCSCCKHFIKQYGNIVAIKDNKIISLWDFHSGDMAFDLVADKLSEYIHSCSIQDVFLTNDTHAGTAHNIERLESGETIQWDHLYLDLPEITYSRQVGTDVGNFKVTRDVLKRGIEEITVESLEIVLELIAQNSLYRGAEKKELLKRFVQLKKDFKDQCKNMPDKVKELFFWEKAVNENEAVIRIRKTSIGTLLIDISEGTPLDIAVRKYEKVVAPENYKRSKPIFTKKMIEDAEKKIISLGFMDSLPRRYANLDDITINNVLFADRDTKAKLNGGNIFDEMKKDIVCDSKKFSRIEEISIKDFIANVLPNANSIEAYFDNKLISNLCSLIAPVNKDSKSMFKWNNNFSWAYKGNIADSAMKQRVKAAGGNVDGVLRFSIQWNELDDYNQNDHDAHCIEPNGFEIMYNKKRDPKTCGDLDVDIINPQINIPAVENITWPSLEKMPDGTYQMSVVCYSNNGGQSGFRAEIEFDGQIYNFAYNKPMKTGERVQVANVIKDENGFRLVEKLPGTASSIEKWNLKTGNFVPVHAIMYSPNYWDEQKGIGNQHVFFMLKDCISDETPNGFYNEFLNNELMEHRKVLEALGSKMAVKESNDQLSGLGFSMTRRAELIVKVNGSSERTLKIKF